MFNNITELAEDVVLNSKKRIGVVLIALVGAGIFSATSASAAGCEPGPKEVTFYEHSYYKGTCSVLGVGKYPNSKTMRVRNDSISSIKLGSRVTVTVCKHAAKGRVTNKFFSRNPQKCETYKRSDPYLKDNRVGNDTISSAIILPIFGGYAGNTNGACKPRSGQEAVAVYQNPNYTGSCRLLTLGTYNNSKEMRIKNDSISSIEFGSLSNVEILVYQHSKRRGRVMRLRKSISNLKNSKIGDNSISSVSVTRKK